VEIVPEEMLKLAELAFAATETLAGTVRTPAALFVSVTETPPAGAACESVTWQVVFAFAANAEAVQLSPVTVVGAAGACSEICLEAELLFSDAVKTAVWLVLIEPVEMLKAAEVAVAGTITDAGETRVEEAVLDKVTEAPPAGAG